MTITLTDRYVDEALRGVPDPRRSDIENELRASIADAIDARVAAGEEHAAAEVAVLTELGDPGRLAAGYAETPLHLIGPELYLDYVRLLRVLAATVLPVAAVTIGVVQIAVDKPIMGVIGSVVGVTISIAVHLAFWTTLVFVLLERVGKVKTPIAGQWNPSMLPASRSRDPHLGEVVAGVVFAGLLTVAILLAPSVSPVRDAAGDPVNVLHPWLWDSGAVYALIGLIVAGAAVAIVSRYRPRLWPLTMTLGVVGAGLVLVLAVQERFVNPAFADAAGWTPEVTRWIHIGLVITALLSIGSSIVDGVRQARRR